MELDKDENGSVSEQEFTAVTTDGEKAEAKRLFVELDRNDDKQLCAKSISGYEKQVPKQFKATEPLFATPAAVNCQRAGPRVLHLPRSQRLARLPQVIQSRRPLERVVGNDAHISLTTSQIRVSSAAECLRRRIAAFA